jgi:hypothetical protein
MLREPNTEAPAPQSAPPAAASSTKTESVARARGAGPVHLKWQASNDQKIFGYLIYRAIDRAGPFVRVSKQPVRGTRKTDGTASDYAFTDADVEPGKTYYYYLDSLATNGSQERLSPVLSKTVTPNP